MSTSARAKASGPQLLNVLLGGHCLTCLAQCGSHKGYIRRVQLLCVERERKKRNKKLNFIGSSTPLALLFAEQLGVCSRDPYKSKLSFLVPEQMVQAVGNF